MKFVLVCVLFVAACAAEVQRYDTIPGSNKKQEHVTIDGKFCMGTCQSIQCEGWVDSYGRSTPADIFTSSSRAAQCVQAECERDCGSKKAEKAACLGNLCCCFNGAPKIGNSIGLLAIFVAIIYGKLL